MSISLDSISAMMNTTQSNMAANNAASMKSFVNGLSSESSEEELMQVCKDFTSYFVEEILKEVKENMTMEDEEGDSSLKTLTDFHMDSAIQVIAGEVIDQVGGSFTQQLYEQMKRNYNID